MSTSEIEKWTSQKTYKNLSDEAKRVFSLINKYHSYFSTQDRKYKVIVRIVKVTILSLSMLSTIVLGLKTIIQIDLQVVIGLILSALITFTSAILSYFNFEEYWMRNISVHIELNILRDTFILDVEANKIDETRIKFYRDQLDDIQKNNIKYWEKIIKKLQ